MDLLKKKFIEKAIPVADEIKQLVKEKGNKVIGNYTVEQVVTGMKGIIGLLTLTSKLDAQEGIRFRGYSIPELQQLLPKLKPEDETLPEGLFHLLLYDEVPTLEQALAIGDDWKNRSAKLPSYVFDVLNSMPDDSHPMVMFSTAIMSMANESKFLQAYLDGTHKKEYWDSTYEDMMNLISYLPRIAAYIYRKLYYNNEQIEPDHNLDWAANMAHMMGYDNPEVQNLIRLYLCVHADHEGGNVSAHATHLVGSALSNPYYAFAAGMAGLAGPLHGMANQEVMNWLDELRKELNMYTCCDTQRIVDYVHKTLSEGRVVPGFGHAVLRKTDPRYITQREFALKYMPDDDNFLLVSLLYDIIPPILESTGKVKNPWPNVDAHSGILLLHYGIKESPFYTVLFGVSRALGVLAQLLWDRALGSSIERPKSENLEWLRSL